MSVEFGVVLGLNPDLNVAGFGTQHGEDQQRDRQQLIARESFIMALSEWLRRNATTTTRYGNSYSLKHELELRIDDYVANGEFIAAAIMAGFKVRRIDGSPNALVDMKSLVDPHSL